MIFVDDCGSDDSMDRVRMAAREDVRIRMVNNEKSIGAGLSRNRGIEVAQGEYLSFVDPDDYLSSDFLELLYAEAASGSFDIVKGSTIREKEDGTVANINRTPNKVIRNSLARGNALYTVFTSEHTTAIYRREFIHKNGICYGASSRAQDTVFLLQACSQADSFSIVDEAYYHYCERSGTAMNTMDEDKIQGFLLATKEQIDFTLNSIHRGNDAMLLMKYIFFKALGEFLRYDDVPEMKSYAEEYLSELKSLLSHLPFSEDFADSSAPLRFLRDYGVGLPLAPYYSPWEGNLPPLRYAKLAERWTNFYLDHPKEKRTCQKPLILIFTKAWQAIHFKTYTSYAPEEYILGEKLLKEQTRKLPISLQLKIRQSIARKSHFGFCISHNKF